MGWSDAPVFVSGFLVFKKCCFKTPFPPLSSVCLLGVLHHPFVWVVVSQLPVLQVFPIAKAVCAFPMKDILCLLTLVTLLFVMFSLPEVFIIGDIFGIFLRVSFQGPVLEFHVRLRFSSFGGRIFHLGLVRCFLLCLPIHLLRILWSS